MFFFSISSKDNKYLYHMYSVSIKDYSIPYIIAINFNKIVSFIKGPNAKIPCPPHIQVDYNTLNIIFLYLPNLNKIPYPVTMDMNLAKEYYK